MQPAASVRASAERAATTPLRRCCVACRGRRSRGVGAPASCSPDACRRDAVYEMVCGVKSPSRLASFVPVRSVRAGAVIGSGRGFHPASCDGPLPENCCLPPSLVLRSLARPPRAHRLSPRACYVACAAPPAPRWCCAAWRAQSHPWREVQCLRAFPRKPSDNSPSAFLPLRTCVARSQPPSRAIRGPMMAHGMAHGPMAHHRPPRAPPSHSDWRATQPAPARHEGHEGPTTPRMRELPAEAPINGPGGTRDKPCQAGTEQGGVGKEGQCGAGEARQARKAPPNPTPLSSEAILGVTGSSPLYASPF